ncbi:MAG: MarR family transcriptional regulator [Psychromonas sp.]
MSSSEDNRYTAGFTWIAMRLLHNDIQVEINKINDKINVEQLLLLMELEYEDGLRPSILAKRMARSKGTISSLIRHATRNEYVAMSSDPLNKNAKRIFLTVFGKKVHDQLKPVLTQSVNKAMKDVSEEHRQIVMDAMTSIIKTYSPEWVDDFTD